MDELQQATTVAVKACSSCASGILERDKFCRWCGARQPELTSAGLRAAQDLARSAAIRDATPIPATSMLSHAGRGDVYRSVSGPLVSAVVTGALIGAANNGQSPFLKRLTLALISIPIWLMIVLLSPLDAYAAVKTLTR